MNNIIREFIKKSIDEDLKNGDLTSLACICEITTGRADLISKENCIIAGIELAKAIYEYYDSNLSFTPFYKDGQLVQKGSTIFSIIGKKHSILATERIILNCIQRMSGIATNTNKYVKKLQGLSTKILDTRKTCPSIRFLDKQAVKIGGGNNHRNSLYDVIMIKDNHIDFCGGIENAIQKCNEYLIKNSLDQNIIIEVRSIEELHKVLNFGKINRILLDNFDIIQTKQAVSLVNGRYPLESSGNINLKTVREYALCGVDFISIGALTHSVKSVDLSMICR